MRASNLILLSSLVLLGLTGCTSELIRASTAGDNATVASLLSSGADPEENFVSGCKIYPPAHGQFSGRETPLICAAIWGRTDTVKLLLERGANPNAVDYVQHDALYYAARYGYSEIVAALLSRGAARHAHADAALQIARRYGHLDTARLLEQSSPQSTAVTSPPPIVSPVAPVHPPSIQSDADTPRYALPESGEKFAVIVGIDHYENLSPAAYAERDAAAVRAHLLALGYPQRNIAYLVGSQASFTNIKKYIESWLPNRVTDQSTVFVYFSGHGAPDAKTNQAYLVPFAGDPEYLEDTSYPVSRLYSKLNELKAKTVLVALDSCFSGAGGRSVLAKGVRPLMTRVEMGQPLAGKIVTLSASAANEISGTLEDQGHGAFTYYLLKGLNGGATDSTGKVTVSGLFDYLKPKVQDSARLSNRDQTPQLFPATGNQTSVLIR